MEGSLKKEFYELVCTNSSAFDFSQTAGLDGLWYWDIERSDQCWANPKFWHTLGYDTDYNFTENRTWEDYISPECLVSVQKNMREYLKNRNTDTYDQVLSYLHKDGHVIQMRCQGMTVRDKTGKPIRMLGAHTRDTAEKPTGVLQHILDKKSIYVIKTDMEGRYTYVNDYFCDQLNVKREDVIGQISMVHILPMDHEKCIRVVERCIAEPEKPVKIFLRKPKPGGGIFTNQWEFTAITDQNNVPQEILCIGWDVSEKEQIESEIKALFDLSNDLLVVANFGGYFERLNPKWVDLTGFSLEELTSQPFVNFVHPEDRDKTSEETVLHAQGGEVMQRFENRYRCKDGKYVWLEWNSNTNVASRKIYAVARDITLNKRKEQLRERVASSLLKASKNSTLQKKSLERFLHDLTEDAFTTLDLTQFSIWFYEDNGESMRCHYFSSELQINLKNEVILRSHVPDYFEELDKERVLALSDIVEDPRTKDLEGYANRTGIRATLDVQVYQGVTPIGVLCAENETARKWLYEEESYLNNLAEIIATALVTQKRKESEERYRSAVDALSEGLVVQDLEDNILAANQAAANILGLSMEQLLGKSSYDPHWKATNIDDSPLEPTQHPSVITNRTGKPVDNFLMNVNTGEGERRIISINSRPIKNDQDEMYSVVVSFSDVTIEKSALNELRLSNKFLNLAQKVAKTGHYRFFPFQNRWESSEELNRILGIDKSYTRSVESWAALIHPEESRAVVAYLMKEVLEERQRFNRRYRIIHQVTGEIVWIDMNGTLIENDKKEVVEMFGTVQDVTEQQRRERELAEEARGVLQSAADNIPGLMYQYILHPDGTDSLPYASKGLEDLFEVGQEAINSKGYSLWERVYAEDNPKVKQSIVRSAKTLENWEVEFRLQMDDGRIKWIIGRGTPQKRSNGDICWNSIALDITSQREAERELRENTLLLNSINQNINEGIYRSDKHSLVYANESFVRMFRYDSIDEVMEIDPVAFYANPDDRQELREQLVVRENKLGGKEVRFVRKDGSTFWASVNVTCSVDENGDEIFDGAIRDITTQKQAEEKLLQSEQKFRFLVEKITDIVVLWNKSFQAEYISPAVEYLLGYTSEEYKNFNLVRHIPKEDRRKVLDAMRQIREGDGYLDLDHRILRKDGKVVWLRNQVRAFRDQHGEIMNILTNSHDITELVKRQEELRKLVQTTTTQNNRLKEFSYITSHNIRSSVANLLGLTDLLNSDPGNPQYVKMINQSTNRLDKTIKNINILLQIEQDSKLLEQRVINVLEAVERALNQNTKFIQEQNAVIEVDVPQTLNIYTIPVYIDSIIQNLITNALKYGITPISQKIKICAYIRDKDFCLEVQDHGRGIDLDRDGDQLFKLGTRLHDVSTGQGLGLYMSKRHSVIMGGRIDVKSKVNHGTTFCLYLPAAPLVEDK